VRHDPGPGAKCWPGKKKRKMRKSVGGGRDKKIKGCTSYCKKKKKLGKRHVCLGTEWGPSLRGPRGRNEKQGKEWVGKKKR